MSKIELLAEYLPFLKNLSAGQLPAHPPVDQEKLAQDIKNIDNQVVL
jgi:hypothetical protein